MRMIVDDLQAKDYYIFRSTITWVDSKSGTLSHEQKKVLITQCCVKNSGAFNFTKIVIISRLGGGEGEMSMV